MRAFAVVSAFLCLLLAFSFSCGGMAEASVTAKDIPSIEAGDLLKKISEQEGKIVVVNIFASWCPPCLEEIPRLIAVRKEYKEEEVVMWGVSVDKNVSDLVKYMKKLPFNYPVMLGVGDFVRKVGVTAVPQLLIYDKKGELVVNHRGLVDEADLKQSIEEIRSK